MTGLNPLYVLAPLELLLAQCHSNVMTGSRLVERVQTFPDPTPEEVQFIQLSFGGVAPDFTATREIFRRWLLLNGFEDVHKAIRHTLERFVTFKTIGKMIADSAITNTLDEHEMELQDRLSRFHLPRLLDEVASQLGEPFKYLRTSSESYNAARNCLEHTRGRRDRAPLHRR